MMPRQQSLFGGAEPDLCAFVGINVRIRSEADNGRAAQLAMLEALLRSPGDCVTVDTIVRDLNRPFADGGRWLGRAIKQLADDRIIRSVGAVNSRRKPRHGGLSRVWELLDADAAKLRAKRLRSALTMTTHDSAATTAKS